MTTTTARSFDRMMSDDRWGGYGFLGGREIALDNSDAECPARPELVATIDRLVLEATAEWSADDLFHWANSKDGRHFADVVFGGNPHLTAEARFAEAVSYGLLRKQQW
jgi:hypothetical protein